MTALGDCLVNICQLERSILVFGKCFLCQHHTSAQVVYIAFLKASYERNVRGIKGSYSHEYNFQQRANRICCNIKQGNIPFATKKGNIANAASERLNIELQLDNGDTIKSMTDGRSVYQVEK